MNELFDRLTGEISAVMSIRHEIHSHPELAFEEHRTSEIVQRELGKAGIEFRAGLAKGTGVLGFLPATTNPATAKTYALRADMDALPIEENTGVPYTSQVPGKMHACGHDGHTAILLGVAHTLAKQTYRPNNILFVFQPAEEGGGGGQYMCQDGCLDGRIFPYKADMIFGLHGWTTVKQGKVATIEGSMMAATNTYRVTVKGRGGHAAHPETTVDPLMIGAYMVTALQTICSRNVSPLDSIVVSVTQFHAGTAENIIPETVWFGGTMRTMLPETRILGEKRFKEIIHGTAAAFGAEVDLHWEVGYPVTINHPDATARFLRIASETIGAENVNPKGERTMGAEDFSYYGYEIPGCFFQLGLIPPSRDTYESVHTPYFNFNDEAIETGLKLFCALALDES